jgi:hypothetical protein
VEPYKPIGEPATVVALDDQVVVEQLIFNVGAKKNRELNSFLFISKTRFALRISTRKSNGNEEKVTKII